ncbi:MAG: NAD(P)H-dependent oxidoreductase, partial [Candidatus Nanohaloarchaea archaeon]|nr:NAD(P)H-dependent oxidoreductase [Candidatus Nanohaloarchaea archaeon]
MNDTLRFLVVEGTVRDGRKSIHAARYLTGLLEDEGYEADLYDMKERDIPLMETRRYADPGDPPQDVEAFGALVEAADGIVLVAPEYNHSYPGALKNLVDYLYPEYEDK